MALPKLSPSIGTTDIQSTTLGTDLLSRFICNTWEEATIDSAAIDVVVIGSGMYGGYCASKIYELSKARYGENRPLRVLVLEAGPFVIAEHGQNIPNLNFFTPNGTQAVGSQSNPDTRGVVWGVGWRSNQEFVGQAYCVGGKSLFWGGWCPRLQDYDLDQWPEEVQSYLTQVNDAAPAGKRPVSHYDKDLDKFLQRGEALSGYETLEYEIGAKPTDDFIFDPVNFVGESKQKDDGNLLAGDKIQAGLNETLLFYLKETASSISSEITEIRTAPLAIQTQSYISGLFSLDKYSSVPALSGSARADHADGKIRDLRMCIVPNAHVIKLDCAPSGESEIGTRLVDRIQVKVGGESTTLNISPFCQVVLALSCIESTRLALESFSLESSGLKGLGEELMGKNFMFHLRQEYSFRIDKKKFADFVSKVWPEKRLADVLQQASLHIQCRGNNGTYQYQLYAAGSDNSDEPNLYRMIPDLDIQSKIADGFDSNLISFILRSSGEVKGGRASSLRDPNFDYIDLAGDIDFDSQFGHRRAWVQFKVPDSAHINDPIWNDMEATARKIASALDGGQVPLDFAVLGKQGVGTTFHDSGTLWMGDDPESSVTDVNGHFHHMTNAYCADQALFTTVGSANPVLTGLSLARKVAEDIVVKHGPLPQVKADLNNFKSILFGPVSGWLSFPYNGMQLLENGIIAETTPFMQQQRNENIGFYYLPESLEDFELYVEWKAFRGASLPNSGVLLRMKDPTGLDFSSDEVFQSFYDTAIEIQIDDLGKNFDKTSGKAIFGDSKYKTGAVYGSKAASQWAGKVWAPDGDDTAGRYWNFYRITMKGSFVTVNLNGKIVCSTEVVGKNKAGFIGLQFHSGKVQFRNFKLKK